MEVTSSQKLSINFLLCKEAEREEKTTQSNQIVRNDDRPEDMEGVKQPQFSVPPPRRPPPPPPSPMHLEPTHRPSLGPLLARYLTRRGSFSMSHGTAPSLNEYPSPPPNLPLAQSVHPISSPVAGSGQCLPGYPLSASRLPTDSHMHTQSPNTSPSNDDQHMALTMKLQQIFPEESRERPPSRRYSLPEMRSITLKAQVKACLQQLGSRPPAKQYKCIFVETCGREIKGRGNFMRHLNWHIKHSETERWNPPHH